MKKSSIYSSSLLLLACLLFSNLISAQRGGRLGIINGVSKISIKNANDAAAADNKLALLNTMGAHYGIEAGYSFRYIGVSMQLMRSQAGQKYMVDSSIHAQTRFTYLRPTFLINFNSNPKNDVRFSGYVGAAYGLMTKYTDVMYAPNPFTGAISDSKWLNQTLTITDTGVIKADVSQSLFNKTDLSLIAALGGEFRLSKKFLLGVHARMDMGMQALENLNKMTFKYQNKDLGTIINYEPWKNTPYRFHKDLAFKSVRANSTNMSTGIFVSIKYMLFSNSVYEYEMDGY